MRLVRIPRVFFDDHRDRGLDTPKAHTHSERHVWIDPTDAATAELVADAEHYTSGLGPDCPHTFGLKSSARATLAAIAKAEGGAS